MPKFKIHKGLKKRVRASANGKLLHKKAGMGHLLSGKSGERKLNLRRPGQITGGFAVRAREMLGVKENPQADRR